MKSKQNESRLETSCETCYFAIYESHTQTGCGVGRIEKLIEKRPESVIEAYGEDKDFYVIQEFCTYFRNPEGRNISDDSEESVSSAIEQVKKSAAPKFCIIVDADKISSTKSLDHLVESLESCEYYKEKISVIIHHKQSQDQARRRELASYYRLIAPLVHTCRILELSSDHDSFSHTYELFRHVNTTYTIQVDPTLFDSSIMNDINNSINTDLNRGLFFNKSGVEAVSFPAFRAFFKRGETHSEFKKSFKERCDKEGFLVKL